MTGRFLLDVNVLLAIVDENHLHHERAAGWFDSVAPTSTWFSCPITINGAIRILINSSITSAAPTAELAAQRIADLASTSSYQFVTDDIDLTRHPTIDLSRLRSHTQITDVYLLALAVRHGAMFATMDRKIDPGVVSGGDDAYFVIP